MAQSCGVFCFLSSFQFDIYIFLLCFSIQNYWLWIKLWKWVILYSIYSNKHFPKNLVICIVLWHPQVKTVWMSCIHLEPIEHLWIKSTSKYLNPGTACYLWHQELVFSGLNQVISFLLHIHHPQTWYFLLMMFLITSSVILLLVIYSPFSQLLGLSAICHRNGSSSNTLQYF